MGKPLRSYAEVKEPQRPKPKHPPAQGDPELRAFVHQQPCLVASPACRGLIECAHVRSRGAGGKDWDNLVPLCTHHHREQHYLGRRSFEFRYKVRLLAAARKITTAYIRLRQSAVAQADGEP